MSYVPSPAANECVQYRAPKWKVARVIAMGSNTVVSRWKSQSDMKDARIEISW